MDTQKVMAAWKAKNDKLATPVKVDLTGVGELYVRLLKADESEHIDALRERAKDDATATPLAVVSMLCHEDGRRLSSEESEAFFDMLVASPPTAADVAELHRRASGRDDSGN